MGTLAALLGRPRDGGCDVDVSLFDVALHQLTYPGTWYMNHGIRTERLARSAHPSNVPVQLYRTRDGWIFIMCMTQKFWLLLLDAMGHPELAADPRFVSMQDRNRNRDELTILLDRIFMTADTDSWIERLQTLVPVAPVHDLPDALDNPYVRSIGMIQTMPYRDQGTFEALCNPIKLDGARLPGAPGHGLGADNEAILGKELGLADELDALRDEGVI